MELTLNKHKELFSIAYAKAVAAAAGVVLQEADSITDGDGIDVEFKAIGKGRGISSPRLEAQLKATAKCNFDGDAFIYDLDRKNYDDLIDVNYVIPRILIVILLPGDNPEEWLSHSSQAIRMSRCGYYAELSGKPSTTNKESVRIRIPETQCFSPENLKKLLWNPCSGGSL